MFKKLVATLLAAVCCVLFAAAWPHGAAAEGAMALGVTGNITKDGYAIGINVNSSSEAEARDAALKYCRTHGGDAAHAQMMPKARSRDAGHVAIEDRPALQERRARANHVLIQKLTDQHA